MLYSSIENNKIKELKKLNEKKYRDISNKFLVEGWHLIKEAKSLGILDEVYLLEKEENLLDVEVNYVTLKVLKYLSNLESPKVIGVVNKLKEQKLGNSLVILDDIQDPGNLGTIIRSAVAFNISTIVLSDNTVDLYNDKVIRASQGMLFKVNIIRKNLEEFLDNIKDEYYIYGTKVTDGKSIKSLEKRNKFAIIMGNEGKGMSSKLEKFCNEFIYIDMNKNCESLNVGVATSIILYELDK